MFLKKMLYNMVQNSRKRKLKKCGNGVRISSGCHLQGNIECGNNVTIGYGNYFVSTRATLRIHDYCVFGPNVTIYTGDHPTDVIGQHISEITDKDKIRGGYDADITIEAGCWIGTRAIILKGVTIGKGSVIGAGAVVTKDVPPYSVYVGVPERKCFSRFTEKEIEEHERILKERNITIQ